MRIFLSYSSKDKDVVSRLVSDLEDLGHDVWFDQQLSGGQEWWGRIIENICTSDVFVFALSPAWITSHPCSLEFEYATSLHKNRLPVQITQIDNVRTLPEEIQKLQFVDYVKSTRDSLKALSRAINNLPAPEPLPEILPEPPETPISKLSKISHELRQPQLSSKRQREIFNQLINLLEDPVEKPGAIELLLQLEKHADTTTPLIKEIGLALRSHSAGASFKLEAANVNLNPAQETHFVLEDVNTGTQYKLTNKRIIVGKATSCDLVINDPFFSRMQFVLNWSDEKQTYLLVDTRAANPVFLNDEKLDGKDQLPLTIGDEIRCGQTVLKYLALQ